MKPTNSALIKRKVKYGIENNEIYFDVEELRVLYPDLRFPPDKIKQVNIGGMIKSGIKQQDIKELSEFEKNIVKLYHNK